MKFLLTILFLYSFNAFAGSVDTSRYVDPVGGLNTNNGYTSTTPYFTVAKAKANVKAGDTIFVKRGTEVNSREFMANFTPSQVNIDSIVIMPYGTGANPKWTGWLTPTTWTADGTVTGLWWASSDKGDGAAPSNVYVVSVDDTMRIKGRWPRSTYRAFQGHTKGPTNLAGQGSLTDTLLPGASSLDFDGAEVVIRTRNWLINRFTVTNHHDSIVNYTQGNGQASSNLELLDNYGYFFQNKKELCTVFGDWMFDSLNKRVYVQFGADLPSAHTTKLSYYSSGVQVSGKNITVKNIDFEGQNQYGVTGTGTSSNITVDSCNFRYIGSEGFYSSGVPGMVILNSNFKDLPNTGIRLWQSGSNDKNHIVKGNTFKRIGTQPGMGQSGDLTYTAIVAQGDSVLVRKNRIDTVGYNGIHILRNNYNVVDSNYVNYGNFRKGDGALIYAYGGKTMVSKATSYITDNILLNSIGALEGASGTSYELANGITPNERGKGGGIYGDEMYSDAVIKRNYIENAATWGIFIHHNKNLTIDSNIIVNAWKGIKIRIKADISSDTTSSLAGNINVTNNTFLVDSVHSDALAFEYNSAYYQALVTGTWSGNKYYTKTSGGSWFWAKQGEGATVITRNLSAWQTYTGKESGSTITAWSTYLGLKNPTNATANQSISGTMQDSYGIPYTSIVPVPAWSGKLLLPSGGVLRITVDLKGKIIIQGTKILLKQ